MECILHVLACSGDIRPDRQGINHEYLEKAEAKGKIVQLGKKLVSDIERGTNPSIEVPVRSLSNISFDTKAKTLVLGSKKAQRFFFNIGHVRRFTQTI